MPSPHITAIPAEILAEIFYEHIQSVSTDPEDLWRANPTLRLVCHQWNTVVLASPRLWSNICIIIDHISLACPPIHILHLWLDRSANLPLDIELGCGHLDETMLNHASHVLDSLIFHIHRWHHFTTSILAHDVPFGRAHQLEYVSIESDRQDDQDYEDSDGYDGDDEDLISSLALAPLLHSLCLMGDSVRIARSLFASFPLKKLTQLDLSCPMPVPGLLNIMRSCTSVTEMNISIQTRDDWNLNVYGPLMAVSLPTLRVFHLTIDDPDHGYIMFDYLDLPNLQILTITTLKPHTPRSVGHDITPLSRYLSKTSQSSQSLQALTVEDYALQLHQLTPFLSDPLVARIPIVGVLTTPLPDEVRPAVDRVVGTHPPNTQRVNFQFTPSFRLESDDLGFVGWTSKKTYDAFKQYFPSSSVAREFLGRSMFGVCSN